MQAPLHAPLPHAPSLCPSPRSPQTFLGNSEAKVEAAVAYAKKRRAAEKLWPLLSSAEAEAAEVEKAAKEKAAKEKAAKEKAAV